MSALRRARATAKSTATRLTTTGMPPGTLLATDAAAISKPTLRTSTSRQLRRSRFASSTDCNTMSSGANDRTATSVLTCVKPYVTQTLLAIVAARGTYLDASVGCGVLLTNQAASRSTSPTADTVVLVRCVVRAASCVVTAAPNNAVRSRESGSTPATPRHLDQSRPGSADDRGDGSRRCVGGQPQDGAAWPGGFRGSGG